MELKISHRFLLWEISMDFKIHPLKHKTNRTSNSSLKKQSHTGKWKCKLHLEVQMHIFLFVKQLHKNSIRIKIIIIRIMCKKYLHQRISSYHLINYVNHQDKWVVRIMLHKKSSNLKLNVLNVLLESLKKDSRNCTRIIK